MKVGGVGEGTDGTAGWVIAFDLAVAKLQAVGALGAIVKVMISGNP